MSILSFEFLALIALALIAYYALPLKIRWVVLLAASAAYIAFSGWVSAAHLSAVALLMWAGGLALHALADGLWRKLLLALLLILDLGAMALLKFQPSVWELIIPLGLSYFTFQSAGYLIDVYRRKADAQKNPLKAWLFIGYFPQLAQGPISQWKELGGQLMAGHRLEPVQVVSGFQLMLWGYFKKLVIADRLAATTAALLAENAALPGWFVVGGVALYTIRLYMDFSGGMDVIRGISRMFGIELPENFRRPFFAQSVAEYWRRWHITLGAWFRSYLLYPLTTSRAALWLGKAAGKAFGKKTGRVLPSALATVLIFLLIGLWHGASVNAVVYGAYFGLLMAISMLLEPAWKILRREMGSQKSPWMAALRLVRTWLLILPVQYFAFTPSPAQSLALLGQSLAGWDFADFSARMVAVMQPLEWIIAGAGLLLVLGIDLLLERKMDVGDWLAKARIWVRWPVLLLLLLCILIFGIYGSGYDAQAFLYTQF
ncbi:MAG: hypothetical protein LBM74_05905 [Oscillospiraceae bacterium]|jgi:D-alanyl-lipoteichoic acid acyltransferase DltB (MBOAT superfamily)|nr:hypothetical protein [Oscillospiraceae bacterium]